MNIKDPFTIKGVAAEFAACLGAEIIPYLVIDWKQ